MNQGTKPPDPPSGLQATPKDEAVALEWDAVEAGDLAGYTVYRSTAPGVSTSEAPVASGITSTNHLDEPLQNGRTYHYVVVAFDSEGNESQPSNEVQATPVTDPPDLP